ncbi:aldehyde dehydrogenase family protein [Rhodococcus sp. 15-725-2-2b]|uniref:aldehyde dehydrogenase family protein n=1 Tax=unclassified Rhodococcus (in: high G+C Gram-positive bacteria) TaxID=192944 RepID=UPI000B9B8F18|nr:MULTISPECIES: aldehyde dehydrogenase family protein [unclassified Rhodococcus (in: high G+C Gram-positive bacteria)]OZC61918.1 aldehyde dehydrogenase family protein [Rhodococcus sp. 06-470-2]OZC64584.1 aldehyde dehydrogenase family protein [Rhodococcus sp. 06-469-3-2]OZD51218.1 aldehyde dehydrogenase family protein [Rhodococcus sp. 06-1477-1A]OZE58047.1 aldehyde dehydrogenase family protein [Rhodococcus sp. 05-2221-1B]OZE71657.1 aldehyde dehydrogenase family protein [Rhodococcus sp. 15-725-
MRQYPHLYIDGRWVEPIAPKTIELIDPTREEAFATVALGGVADVDLAVAAARRAFETFSESSVESRIALLDRIIDVYESRLDDFSELIAREVGIPVANRAQVTGPADHMRVARDLLRDYPFESRVGGAIVRREPIGVCGLVSPWNWPVQTGVIKLIYALAAGCTVVAKPSVESAASGVLLAEVLHEAGVPAGVFNLVSGTGREVGDRLSHHPDVDMISFTGSTGAGKLVGAAAATSTVKRVCLELGGKSANIVLPDADLEKAARWNIQRCFLNTGQSCHAPSRMLVHESQIENVVPFLLDEARRFRIGDPLESSTTMGPVVSAGQLTSIQNLIRTAIDEGAVLETGGADRPKGLHRGYFVQPTVFTGVTPKMTIAREEVFGPVLAVLSYRDEDEAVNIANDSPYGLGGYVFGGDLANARKVANRIRAGRISVNGAATDSHTPMGGYKQSGIGRSMGKLGLEEYLEVKSVYGFEDEASDLPALFG